MKKKICFCTIKHFPPDYQLTSLGIFEILPKDILKLILKIFEPRDFIKIRILSKSFYFLVKQSAIWKKLLFEFQTSNNTTKHTEILCPKCTYFWISRFKWNICSYGDYGAKLVVDQENRIVSNPNGVAFPWAAITFGYEIPHNVGTTITLEFEVSEYNNIMFGIANSKYFPDYYYPGSGSAGCTVSQNNSKSQCQPILSKKRKYIFFMQLGKYFKDANFS